MEDDLFGALLAFSAAKCYLACKALGGCPPTLLATVMSLQNYLRERGMRWRLWDRSGMAFFKGPLLYFLVRLTRPQTVVETGVAAGVSTSFILQALQDNGRGVLVSIDLPGGDPQALPETMRAGWIVPEKLRRKWTLVLGDVRTLLPDVFSRYQGTGLILHDDAKAHQHVMWELETSWLNLSPGGLLLLDDIDTSDAFAEFCRKVRKRGFNAYGMGVIRKEL